MMVLNSYYAVSSDNSLEDRCELYLGCRAYYLLSSYESLGGEDERITICAKG